jgi:MmyB-like transcription regulator ligand binding domain
MLRMRSRYCAAPVRGPGPANPLGRALYAPVFDDPHRPANTTRFTYLNPGAKEFWRDYDQIAHDAAAMLRLEAGRDPHDPGLVLNVYTAPAGSPTADALKLLASWAATRHQELAAADPATHEA